MDRKKIKKGYIFIVVGILIMILGFPFTFWFEREILGDNNWTLLYFLIFSGSGFFLLQWGVTMLKVQCQSCGTLNWFYAKKCKDCSSDTK